MATDAELNQYMGVKKYAPYRKGKERWDASKIERLKEFKSAVGKRAWAPWADGNGGKDGGDGGTAEKKKKRKGKKEREREKGAVVDGGASTSAAGTGEKRAAGELDGEGAGDAPKKKRRRKNAPAESA